MEEGGWIGLTKVDYKLSINLVNNYKKRMIKQILALFVLFATVSLAKKAKAPAVIQACQDQCMAKHPQCMRGCLEKERQAYTQCYNKCFFVAQE